MNLPMMIFILVMAVTVMSYISSKRLANQLFISMRTVHDRREEFLVPLYGRFFSFQGKKFNIIPSCCKPMTWKRGIHFIIPTTVQVADYTWSNNYPIDPDTGEIYVDSPEARNRMDYEEKFNAMNKAANKNIAVKETFLSKYGLYIIIGVVVIIGGYMFMKFKSFDQTFTLIGNAIKDLQGKLPK